ncbi:MAG: copper chaperone PCu(A)C [Pseudomonas sp.]
MWRFDSKLLCGLLLAFASAAEAADLQVKDARLRLLPGDLPAAGYFTLTNVSGNAVALVGAESAMFEQVMMHQSSIKDGVASMDHVSQLEVAPGATVAFAPGGYHLMLMKRQQPVSIGDEVTATLVFEDGQRLPVTFKAVSPASQ